VTLRLADKQAIVTEVGEVARKALSVVTAEYRGLSVEEMNQLRAEARRVDVYVRVIRNTLARRALEGTNFFVSSRYFSWSLALCVFSTRAQCSSAAC